MKDFFLALLFSKMIILTPAPISLSYEWYEIKPDPPLSAITSGASIYIDISSKVSNQTDIQALDKMFPAETIIAKLVDEDGKKIILVNGSAYSKGENKLEIVLMSEEPIPTDKEFVNLFIRSKKEIQDVKIIWRNSKL